MNNRNACRCWADDLSKALKAGAALEGKLRELATRDPTDAECDHLIKQAESVVDILMRRRGERMTAAVTASRGAPPTGRHASSP
jgi:hypothetical protein